ncbi:hypothetical protein DFP73DRAFT_524330 [Morchella snyderi]|nr:hypothetical protein DFP73DRAFT_524330 [Morchella snyderi]
MACSIPLVFWLSPTLVFPSARQWHRSGGSGGRGGVRHKEWAVFRVGHFLSGNSYQYISDNKKVWIYLVFVFSNGLEPNCGFDAKSLIVEPHIGLQEQQPTDLEAAFFGYALKHSEVPRGLFTLSSPLYWIVPCLRAAVNDCVGPSPGVAVSSEGLHNYLTGRIYVC